MSGDVFPFILFKAGKLLGVLSRERVIGKGDNS